MRTTDIEQAFIKLRKQWDNYQPLIDECDKLLSIVGNADDDEAILLVVIALANIKATLPTIS